MAFDSSASAEDRRRLLDDITVDNTDANGFEAIDLVDLHTVGPHLGYEIRADGVLLLGDEDLSLERERRFMVKQIDFEPIKTRVASGGGRPSSYG